MRIILANRSLRSLFAEDLTAEAKGGKDTRGVLFWFAFWSNHRGILARRDVELRVRRFSRQLLEGAVRHPQEHPWEDSRNRRIYFAKGVVFILRALQNQDDF